MEPACAQQNVWGTFSLEGSAIVRGSAQTQDQVSKRSPLAGATMTDFRMLDEQIGQLMGREKLTEEAVKQLCEKVRRSLMPAVPAAWRRATRCAFQLCCGAARRVRVHAAL